MSVKNYTIAERYARSRARCPIPPEPAKRRGRPRFAAALKAYSKSNLGRPNRRFSRRGRPRGATRTHPHSDLRRRLADQLQYSPTRPRTPMVTDLERRLAARAGLPRQTPKGPVNLGNRSLDEDRPTIIRNRTIQQERCSDDTHCSQRKRQGRRQAPSRQGGHLPIRTADKSSHADCDHPGRSS